ncbi:MAG: hypothetical protein JWO97_1549 [Acidobacteria bacterium]|nr:hypothetical protein [Acidobacteriota bacterium]
MRYASIALLMLVLAGCATDSNSDSALYVPLVGRAIEQREFAGTWNGAVTFDDAHHNLDSRVTFAIVPGESDVETGRLVFSAPMPQSSLSWVRVDGHRMLGAVPPQFDRDCACTVYTTFEGKLTGEVITGRVQRVENRSRVVTGTLLVSRSP